MKVVKYFTMTSVILILLVIVVVDRMTMYNLNSLYDVDSRDELFSTSDSTCISDSPSTSDSTSVTEFGVTEVSLEIINQVDQIEENTQLEKMKSRKIISSYQDSIKRLKFKIKQIEKTYQLKSTPIDSSWEKWDRP